MQHKRYASLKHGPRIATVIARNDERVLYSATDEATGGTIVSRGSFVGHDNKNWASHIMCCSPAYFDTQYG